MTNAELAAEVDSAGGQVFLGFKEPGMARGAAPDGRIVVSEQTVEQAKAYLRERGIEIQREFWSIPSVVARINGSDVAMLRSLDFLDNIEPILPGPMPATRGAIGPRAIYASQSVQWNVERIGAPTAWNFTTGSGARVLIIDTGIAEDHPALTFVENKLCSVGEGALYPPGYSEEYEWDLTGHGTAVAGVVAATQFGIGVSPGISLYVAKSNHYSTWWPGVICGIEWGREKGVHVINLSHEREYMETAATAIQNAVLEDSILFIAAAGNGSFCDFPASLPEVIAVAATTPTDDRASYSCVQPYVEIAAPGGPLHTTAPGTPEPGYCSAQGYVEYWDCDGTSFAAPHVAAVAGLIKAVNPSLSSENIRHLLQVTAEDLGDTPGWNPEFGHGLVDAAKAVAYAMPFVVTATVPEQIQSPGTYPLSGSASHSADSWVWERNNNDGSGYQVWSSGQSSSFTITDPAVEHGTITWRLTATRVLDGAEGSDTQWTWVEEPCEPNGMICPESIPDEEG